MSRNSLLQTGAISVGTRMVLGLNPVAVTSQLICFADESTCFFLMRILVGRGLKSWMGIDFKYHNAQ